ncbi:hypothetical protein CA267_012740 [Alteromonas pelagimontana]|uniref:Uncharacterized protein n=1 Tax=Alteromonas pelagimontana TaxID=1858656 RepID=A0A6M4MHB7_9ALTE|nr:hypothetical protein [Alteromonas pelagimontana]QJR81576.1 hypothetical protein CA267_012740 [Alteromonas pelagimontana]
MHKEPAIVAKLSGTEQQALETAYLRFTRKKARRNGLFFTLKINKNKPFAIICMA